MGADIHMVWQAKTPNGMQDVASPYDEDMNYLLFGWLAEVRWPDAGAFGRPRGFPRDFLLLDGVMHPTRKELLHPSEWGFYDERDPYKYMGDHSHSWLSWSEILLKFAETKDPELRAGVGYFVDLVREQARLYGAGRIVFGFDS